MESIIKICGRELEVSGQLVRVANLDGEKYRFLDDPEPLLDGLRDCGARIDLFTFVQRLPETAPKYAYPIEWDNFAAIPVSTFDHWWTEQIGTKARNKAKQAGKKGVTIREVRFDENLVRGIWQIYNECPIRQGKPFLHYGKDIESVRRQEAVCLENSIFLGAFLGEQMIGYIKMVVDETRTQAGLVNIVSMIQHRDKAPNNALIAQAVESCAQRAISYLVYSTFAYRRQRRCSLTDFKERNGFQQIDVPRYWVPLTPLGWVGLRLGLHLRLVDYLPHAVLPALRALRSSWYRRKLQKPVEAF
jgi:hypothetical protein